MLCLQCETKPTWISVANAHHDLILIDHAHCEKKAAAFGLSMINRYPSHIKLVHEMIDLVKEEIEHFELVVNELEARGIKLTRDTGNDYVKELHTHMAHNEPERMLDLLIVGAFIEARSCERFSILAAHCDHDDLRALYKSLLASEAGHYRMYTDIAREYYPVERVKKRLKEFGEIEASIVQSLTDKPTMHG
ncbi:tRNA isopentenyl-2-thiomethyl-A-37 hydroxylase MiaE [soil metagenome]